jgi:hypothetical protein
MEPAILAALNASPELCAERKVDVVACGSTLGNLLRFVRGQDKLFRILVEVVEGTVFFIRRENSPRELIPNVRGFGHTFPESYTTWDSDVKGSTSHQRLLSYCFGRLQFLVRFEADGYVSEANYNTSPTKAAQSASDPSSLADLLGSLDTTSISSNQKSSESRLCIKSAGKQIDQSLVFDLKTRSARKRDQDTLGEELPRLWVAQLQKFVLAYHEDGRFNDIRILNVRDKVEEWEKTQKKALSMLAALIHRIIGLVRDQPAGKLEVCHTQIGTMEIREQLPDAGDALSPAVKAMWSARSKTKDEESDLEKGDSGLEWNDGSGEDFTACSESCGYCGRCTY